MRHYLRETGTPREPGISRLNRIPIVDCGEELVDIRKFCTGLVVDSNPSLLRITAARMLQAAQDLLPEGYHFRVRTALRTMEMQVNGYTNHINSLREKHPEWPHSILRREANKFFHPPDQKAPPGHCTGGAVDVGIVDPDGNDMDMTSTNPEGIDSKPTYLRWLTAQARANREMLIQAMTEAGFSNCYDEWWHWSYGDNGWAARLNRPNAIYGMIIPTQEEIAAATVEKPKEHEEKPEEVEEPDAPAPPTA